MSQDSTSEKKTKKITVLHWKNPKNTPHHHHHHDWCFNIIIFQLKLDPTKWFNDFKRDVHFWKFPQASHRSEVWPSITRIIYGDTSEARNTKVIAWTVWEWANNQTVFRMVRGGFFMSSSIKLAWNETLLFHKSVHAWRVSFHSLPLFRSVFSVYFFSFFFGFVMLVQDIMPGNIKNTFRAQ